MSESQQAGKPLSERLEQLDRQITSTFDEALQGLRREIGERLQAASEEVVRWLEDHQSSLPTSVRTKLGLDALAEELGALIGSAAPPSSAAAPTPGSELLDAIARVDARTGQAELLTALVDESAHFAGRSAFFLLRQGRARGWAGRGFGDEDPVSGFEDSALDAPWSAFANASASTVLDAAALGALGEQLGVEAAEVGLAIPFVIRGQISGVLYADPGSEGRLDDISLRLLVHSAAQSLETSAVSPSASPALRLDGELPSLQAPAPAVGDHASPAVEDHATTIVPSAEEPSAEAAPSIDAPSIDVPSIDAPGPEAITVEPVADISEESAEPVMPDPEPVVAPDAEAISDDSDSEELSIPPVSVPSVESTPPEVEDSDSDDESDWPTPEEIAQESEPEPEIEDTNIWELEEEEAGEAPAVEVPSVEVPSVEVPSVEVPSVEVPSVEIGSAPEVPAAEVADIEVPAVDVPQVEAPAPVSETMGAEVTISEVTGETEPAPMPEALELEPPPEPTPPPPTLEAPGFDGGGTFDPSSVPAPPPFESPVGQKTVRLDLSAIQGSAASSIPEVTPPEVVPPEVAPLPSMPSSEVVPPPDLEPLPELTPPPVEEPPAGSLETSSNDFDGDATSPTLGMAIAETPEPPAEVEPPPPSPAGFAAAPSSFTDPAPPVSPPPSSFATPPVAEVEAPPAGVDAGAPGDADPPPAAGGSTEVRPPSDLQGPGLAFAAASQASSAGAEADAEEALHEEARRLARLLVSEIKLYNEEIIEEGRRNGNVYERLKDDIDRSRQMYEERIDPRLADKEDYFYQELVQRLAGGDPQLLGM